MHDRGSVANICVASRLVTILFLSLAASACAELTPQMFSDRLRPMEEPPTEQTVAAVEADIATVQWRYLGAVRGLSNLSPRTSTALIGLSAVALFKGLTNGSSKDIAGAGVLGSAIWAYGSTMTSRPRQQVYIAGVAALSCLVSVAKPYDVPAAWTADLTQKSTNVAVEFEKLRAWRERYGHLSETLSEPGVNATQPKECATRVTCPPVAENDSEAMRAEKDAQCKKLLADRTKRCAGGGGRSARQQLPAPELSTAFNQAVEEQGRLERSLLNADRLSGTIAMAGPKLWDQSVQTQLKVSAEVLKTEPDPTAVLATVKNLHQVAGIVAGTGLPAAGSTQGGAEKPTTSFRSLGGGEQQAIRELQSLLTASYQARIALDRKLAEMDARVAAIGRDGDDCQFTPPGASLTISPAAAELLLPLGAEQTFYVSGGTGIPDGYPVGIGSPKVGSLTRGFDDNNRLRFVYKVPADGAVGDKVNIVFKDGSGQITKEVTVTAIAAAVVANNASSAVGAPANNKTKPGDEIPN